MPPLKEAWPTDIVLPPTQPLRTLGLGGLLANEKHLSSLALWPNGIHWGHGLPGCYITTYLGQPGPLVAQVVWRYFGKRFGGCSLPGQGHSVLHTSSMRQTWASFFCKTSRPHHPISDEAGRDSFGFGGGKLLINKVGKPYITSYVNHVSNHPNAWEASYAYDIKPDIEAFNTNLPTGC